MRKGCFALLVMALLASSTATVAQTGPQAAAASTRPVEGQTYKTRYTRLGVVGEALLYEPVGSPDAAKTRIALVFTHPSGDNLNYRVGPEMAHRGYRTLNVNARASADLGSDHQLGAVSEAIAYMRKLPGVERVVIVGHSGGAHELALYENVAENGPTACNGPEKIYPCRAYGLDKLQKPEGLILMDPPLAAFHGASSLDPAVSASVNQRNPALDMFSAANGFDRPKGAATYSPAFAKRFYAAQAARNTALQAQALARLKLIEAGKGAFANDEPMTIPGLGVATGGARLFQSDPSLLSHTKAPHLLIKGDGTRTTVIIRSARSGSISAAQQVRNLGANSQATTVRGFLATDAIRLRADYAITADDIVGVDWTSAYESPVGNAAGIKVPTLVMAMGCHYLMVPAEKIYDNLAARDKTYAAIEGATHIFTPCKPEYGDTNKRTFDYVDEWLMGPGRF